MKKFISFLLILTTVISCFSFNISAEEGVITDEGRLPFEDVKDNHWFTEAVKFCYVNGVIKGMNEYTFGFAGQLTRAQFVMMLANLEGVDTSTYTVTQFSDVKLNHWYYGAVAWAYENGIVNGMTETTFAPNGKLTRAQLATVMYNYMKEKYTVEISDELLAKYTDTPKESYWYYESIRYAVSAGLISGVTDTTIVPTGVVTRGQAAVIFKNFMEQYYYGSCEHNFTEGDCDDPPTCSLCGLVKNLAKGHSVAYYDCYLGGTCTICQEWVNPSKYLHKFIAATCTEPMTCRRCGVKRGEPAGHKWVGPTCEEIAYCSVCKIFGAQQLEHTTRNGICQRCNAEVFATPLHRAGYYMLKNAHANGDGTYWEAAYGSYENGDEDYALVWYDANQVKFFIEYAYYWAESGRTVHINIPIKPKTQESAATVTLYNSEGKELTSVKAVFRRDNMFYDGFKPHWGEYTNSSKSYVSFIEAVGSQIILNAAYYADYILNMAYGGGAEELGFDYFKNN